VCGFKSVLFLKKINKNCRKVDIINLNVSYLFTITKKILLTQIIYASKIKKISRYCIFKAFIFYNFTLQWLEFTHSHKPNKIVHNFMALVLCYRHTSYFRNKNKYYFYSINSDSCYINYIPYTLNII
jgi:hypothetical protein